MYNYDDLDGLIIQTREALLDNRVVDRFRAYAFPDEALRPSESATSFVSRVIRFLLPGDDANDILLLREKLGYREQEVQEIANLLDKARTLLLADAEQAVLSGTKISCERAADSLVELRARWLGPVVPPRSEAPSFWLHVTYLPEVLSGGDTRCEASNEEELVDVFDFLVNNHFGGLIRFEKEAS